MKKIMTIVVVSAAGLAAASSSFAEPTTNKHGAYIFGELGYNAAKWRDTSVTAGDGSQVQIANGKAAGSTWELGAGYRINTNLALELSYADFGKTKSRLNSAGEDIGEIAGSWQAERLGVLGILPINEQLDVFAKATLNNVHYKVASPDTTKTNSVKPGIGVGLNWHVTKDVAIRGEYEYLPAEIKYRTDGGDLVKTNKLNLLKVGVAYSF